MKTWKLKTLTDKLFLHFLLKIILSEYCGKFGAGSSSALIITVYSVGHNQHQNAKLGYFSVSAHCFFTLFFHYEGGEYEVCVTRFCKSCAALWLSLSSYREHIHKVAYTLSLHRCHWVLVLKITELYSSRWISDWYCRTLLVTEMTKPIWTDWACLYQWS